MMGLFENVSISRVRTRLFHLFTVPYRPCRTLERFLSLPCVPIVLENANNGIMRLFNVAGLPNALGTSVFNRFILVVFKFWYSKTWTCSSFNLVLC